MESPVNVQDTEYNKISIHSPQAQPFLVAIIPGPEEISKILPNMHYMLHVHEHWLMHIGRHCIEFKPLAQCKIHSWSSVYSFKVPTNAWAAFLCSLLLFCSPQSSPTNSDMFEFVIDNLQMLHHFCVPSDPLGIRYALLPSLVSSSETSFAWGWREWQPSVNRP